MESFIDTVGIIIFYAAFVMPVLMTIWFWQYKFLKAPVRLIAGFASGLLFGFLMFHIALAIAFRNGLGPT